MKNAFDYGEHFGFSAAETDIPPRDLEVSEELDTKWTGMEGQGEGGGSEWEWEGQVNRNGRDYIRWVQASLNKILGTRLTVHGVMGAQPRRAIRSFQKRKRLKVDGIVGQGTEAALIAAGAGLSPLATPAIPVNVNDLLRLVGVIVSSLPAVVSTAVKLPTAARFLDAAEQSEARTIYGPSLDFTKILIADGLGFQKRMSTVAVPLSAGSHVVMMMGDLCGWATRPRSATLIHQLAHAWQSQHHGSDAQAFMKNSVVCQVRALAALPSAKAAAAAKAAVAAIRRVVPITLAAIGAEAFEAEDVSAFAYVPGKPFREYAAEQIAQQVEDAYTRTGSPTPVIASTIRSARAHARSLDNESSLTVISFHAKSTPRVIFR